MAPLTPCPLAPDLPLAVAIAHAPANVWLGVWLRWPRPLRLLLRWNHRVHLLMIDGDLGRLLPHCAAVLVRLGSDLAAVPSDELIRARALHVEVSLHHRSAEEVLAACAAARVRVLRSRVVYQGVHGASAAG